MPDAAESDLSEDESEILVYVECEGYVDSNTFKNEKLKFGIAGIDSDHPIMQINGKFYEGTYHDAVGTYMFFEKDDSPVVDDPVFDVPPTLKYVAKTRKLLKMERVFAMQRTEVLGDSNHTSCIPNMDTIKEAGVPPKYQDDALQFWIKMRDDRMQALTTYLEKQQIREEKRMQGIELDSESDDDNPFAMYKPKESKERDNIHQKCQSETAGQTKVDDAPESEDSEISNLLDQIMDLNPNNETAPNLLTKPTKKLTVIDPGPSTSKHCDPAIVSVSSKKKRKATFKVTSKSKLKDVFKKPNKRAPKSKKSLTSLPLNQYTDDSVKVSLPEQQAELSSDETNISETEVSEKQKNEDKNKLSPKKPIANTKTTHLISKKLEKQAKREAKMKEISERLKTHKDELFKTKNSGNVPES